MRQIFQLKSHQYKDYNLLYILSKLLSFDCHTTKNEPRNAVISAFLGSCTLFKLLGGEINLVVSRYTFVCFILRIHRILHFYVPRPKFLEPK